MSHPIRPNEEPMSVSVQKVVNQQGHQLSVITVTDPNADGEKGKRI